MALTLGEAARLVGKGKTTLARAIAAGRLSATRRDDGSYSIDPAELHRAFNIRLETPETVPETGSVVRDATPPVRPPETGSDSDVTARLATLETELRGMKALLDEVRQSRDDWREQATRLALPAPAAARSWWRWR